MNQFLHGRLLRLEVVQCVFRYHPSGSNRLWRCSDLRPGAISSHMFWRVFLFCWLATQIALANPTRPGTPTWSGSLPAPVLAVTVNGATAQTNGDFTFASSGLTLSNGANTFTVIAANALGLHTTNTFTRNLPVSANLQYDADGNLLTDGARCFTWNEAGQLTAAYVTNQWKTVFLRDGLGRVRVASDFGWQSSAWVQTNETHFIYDGQLLLQERDAANNVQVTYTRGLDLGGSFAGAGGIGGLLARTDAQYATNSPLRQTSYHSDAAGNVTALLDGNENVAARYLYDPFGRLLGQWGSLANANRMQFSSMPHHGNSGLSLYPFRAYDPVLQRWLSRDPIGEAGGIDLYAFAGNSPLNAVDSVGRVLHILAGAAAGALIGGGFSIASDLFHGRDVDWVQAGISATEGAIAGAVASATFGTSLAGSGLALAARGAAAGLGGDLAAQGAGLAAQTRQCFSFKEAGLSTLLGAGGPLAGKLLGKFFERFAKVEIPVAAKSELGILGKGSTADLAKGTTLPRNLREQLAIEQAAASPAAGTKLPINMTDPRWPGAQGWEKWQQVIKPGGDPINVHYLRNPVTGQIDDFKIVVPGAR